MTVSPTVGAKRSSVAELDILRGWAAILMIVNHAGYHLLSTADARSGSSGLGVFVGSFAPVLFFFATGFGTGLGAAATGRAPRLGSTLWKAALLIAADQAVYWREGEAFGLNFFSFIGISAVTVSLIARARRSMAIAGSLIVAIVVVRYLAGPFIRGWLPVSGPLDWLTGLRVVAEAAYPFSPWMVYPLLGYVFGRLHGGDSLGPRLRQWLGIGALACVLSFASTAAMLWAGAHLLRWSTVSTSYFVLSLGVLAAFGLLSVASARAPGGRALALRGVASFAVIPLHYALLQACSPLQLPLPVEWFVPVTVAIIVASWLLASAFAAVVDSDWLAECSRFVVPALVAAVVALMAIVAIGPHDESASWMTLSKFLAQFAIAGLLGLRAPRRSAQRDPRLRVSRV